MNETFFVSESRSEAPTIELSSTDLPSTVSFDDAVDFGLISEISSFTTQYSSGAEARTVNIHTAAICFQIQSLKQMEAHGHSMILQEKLPKTKAIKMLGQLWVENTLMRLVAAFAR